MVLDNIKWISNFWEILESSKMNCLAWVCHLNALPIVVFHESNLCFMDSTDECVITFQDTLFNEDCGSSLTTFFIYIALNNDTLCSH